MFSLDLVIQILFLFNMEHPGITDDSLVLYSLLDSFKIKS